MRSSFILTTLRLFRIEVFGKITCLVDDDIKSFVKACNKCVKTANDPTKVPVHQWNIPAKPWQCLHIDFVGPYRGRRGCYIVVDNYSEWPKVVMMGSITAYATLNNCRIFSQFTDYPFRLSWAMVHHQEVPAILCTTWNSANDHCSVLSYVNRMEKCKAFFRHSSLPWTELNPRIAGLF